MAPKRPDFDADNAIHDYLEGMSENAVAQKYGVNRWTVRNRLLKAGITPRGQSEAERLKWSRMSPKQRATQVRRAHAASRGRKVAKKTLLKRAETVEKASRFDSPYEEVLFHMLTDRGLDVTPKVAIGIHNCDLGAHPVAVEVLGGNWHTTGDRGKLKRRTFRNMLNAGWDVYAIIVNSSKGLTRAVADDLISYIEMRRRDPSVTREYRVVRGTGELLSSGGPDSVNQSLIFPFKSRRNPRTGRYESIPR